nr:isoprenylcysteine carboxylmethyltransferase family protein [Deinobacterium chartae]
MGVVAAQRLLELRVARRNEAWARARGAVEYGRGHYWMFFVLHPAWMLSFALEGRSRGAPFYVLPAVGYLLLQAARYWVIASLGPYWNTRVLIVPGGERVRHGPFRWLKHPNYVVVALELMVAPLVVGAWKTALVFALLNALLMRVRIPVEERALAQYALRPNR